MGFKESLAKKYSEAYIQKYGDRLTQIQGHVLSVKIATKTILWIYNIIIVDVLVKPERSKSVVKCQFKKKKWFKKPKFIPLNQGNMVIVQGLKPKKAKEGKEEKKEQQEAAISILNVRNLTTKIDLIPVDSKIQRTQQRQYIK